jgi:leader peptidase (prepilin peptidase)/N-methyltransferase
MYSDLFPLWSPAFVIFDILGPLLAGACIGSFLNVCIYRMPLGRSIVHPRSHCAACGTLIPWYDNIPVLSWLLLRGKARCCGTVVDGRYAVVEAMTGILFVVLWNMYPVPEALVYCALTAALITASFIDLDHFIIPDEISLGGAVAGLLISALVPSLHNADSWWPGLKASLIGLVAGGGGLLAIAIIGSLLLRKEAMGMGDVKLLGMLGAFLGWKSIPFIVAVSSMTGAVIGVGLILGRTKKWGIPVPFGPFIALAALIWMLGGHIWMDNYLTMVFPAPPGEMP